MSTRKKECVSDVRGTSPSPSHLRSSPKPSKTVSTSRSLDSSPSEKSIPNYLKPTLSSSSSGDATTLQGKKISSNTDSALKSNLARRRSFDKPPSPTRTLKTRGVSPTPTFRSSSFSGKIGADKCTNTSPKVDRGLKGTRDAGKQPSLYARPVGALKKSATTKSKKAETVTAFSRKDPKHEEDHQESSIAEADGKEHDDSVQADQELANSNQGEIDEDTLTYEQLEDESHKADDSPTVLKQHHDDADADVDTAKVESSPTILELRDANTGKAESDDIVSKVESPTHLGQDDADSVKIESPTASEQHDADAAKVESPVNSEQHVESPTISEQGNDADSLKVESQHEGDIVSADSPTVSEQPEGLCREEISSSQQQEVKEHTANEMDSTNPDQSVAGNPNGEAEDKERDEEERKAVDIDSGGKNHEVQGVVAEDGNAAAKVAHGKKDVALSNNVIEEMIRQKRRNKVKALAGAFETVISLQEPK